MKTVLFYQNKGTNDELFNPSVRDNCNDPFIFLKERLNYLGYEVRLINEDDEVFPAAEAVLFLTPPILAMYGGLKGKIRWLKHKIFGNKQVLKKSQFYTDCVGKGLKDKMVLVLWEGPAVCPANYNKYLHAKFDRVLTWADNYVDGKKFLKFYLPVARLEPVKEIVPFKQKKLLVNISINKESPFKQELYSARKESIKYFDRYYPQDFDLYGYGWNLSNGKKMFNTYRGPVNSKREILSKYKFSLAYENLRDQAGYITEKIFDCVLAGTVPIYWGASNIFDYVNNDVFIDRRRFKNNRELASFITNMEEKEYNKYTEAGRRYLSSEKFKLFSPENFANTVITALGI